MDKVIARLGYTPWFGIIAEFERLNWTAAQLATWHQMKAAYRELATERPYVTYHDVSDGFPTDGTDSMDLIAGGLVHLTPQGYSFYADNLAASLGLPRWVTAVVPAVVVEPLPFPFVDEYATIALFDANKTGTPRGRQ